MNLDEFLCQLGTVNCSRIGLAVAAGVEDGSGDLEQFTRTLDVVTVSLGLLACRRR